MSPNTSLNTKYLWQPVLLCFLLCQSCTRSIEVLLPEPDPLLVVNALFSSDSTWKINVSRTSHLNDTAFILPYVNNAEINLYEDGTFIGSPSYESNGNYLLDTYPQIGKVYRLTVEAPGFPAIEAIDSLPSRAQQITGEWNIGTRVPLVDEFGLSYTSFLLGVRFEDVASEDNFYHISIAKRDSCNCFFPREQVEINNPLGDHLSRLELDVDEPLSDPNSLKSGIALLQDVSFQGIKKELNFYLDTAAIFYVLDLPSTQIDSIDSNFFNRISLGQAPRLGVVGTPRLYIKLFVDIRSISETLYLYESSFFRQGYSTSDPFYEFGNIYSNVTGGLGVFAGYQRDLVEIYSD